jgi:hypothetical protein
MHLIYLAIQQLIFLALKSMSDGHQITTEHMGKDYVAMRMCCACSETRMNPMLCHTGIAHTAVDDGISHSLGVAVKHWCHQTTFQMHVGQVTKSGKLSC